MSTRNSNLEQDLLRRQAAQLIQEQMAAQKLAVATALKFIISNESDEESRHIYAQALARLCLSGVDEEVQSCIANVQKYFSLIADTAEIPETDKQDVFDNIIDKLTRLSAGFEDTAEAGKDKENEDEELDASKEPEEAPEFKEDEDSFLAMSGGDLDLSFDTSDILQDGSDEDDDSDELEDISDIRDEEGFLDNDDDQNSPAEAEKSEE
jgi:hypothetical protein